MACRLCDTKPLPEPMMTYVSWIINNKHQWNCQNMKTFIQENLFKNVNRKMAVIFSWIKYVHLKLYI